MKALYCGIAEYMKRIILVLLLILVFVVSCASNNGSTSLSVEDPEIDMVASASGKTLTVKVYGNPTTGYMWKAEENPAFKAVKADYQASDFPSGMVGGGGYYVFVFEAEMAGQSEIEFEYVRPWNDEEAEEFSIAVSVNKELTITNLEVL